MPNKIILSLAVLIAASAFFYCLVIYLPKREVSRSAETALQNDKVCQEAALRIHSQDGGASSELTQMEPRFKYIESLGLCVYRGGFLSKDGTYEYLKDAMTNEDLGGYMLSPGGKITYGDKNEFENSVRHYFLETN